MDEQKNNIRVLFTVKANSAFDDIIKSFNLEENPEEFAKKIKEERLSNIVVIDHLAKDFARGTISEKDLINSLQKDLEVPRQTAEQISKEIITKIVPFLEKVPEEKFKDPGFVEEISKKIFGEGPEGYSKETKMETEKDIDIFPKIKPPINIIKQAEKSVLTSIEEPLDRDAVQSKRQEKIRKTVASKEIKEPTPQSRQPRGPDNYREPIE